MASGERVGKEFVVAEGGKVVGTGGEAVVEEPSEPWEACSGVADNGCEEQTGFVRAMQFE